MFSPVHPPTLAAPPCASCDGLGYEVDIEVELDENGDPFPVPVRSACEVCQATGFVIRSGVGI